MCAENRDHIPTMAKLQWKTISRTPIMKRRRVGYNMKMVGEPEADEHFRRFCLQYQQPSAFMEPTSHAYIFESFVRDALEDLLS